MFVSVPSSIGLPALAALVLGESAGLPIPGETALIVSGGMASEGHFALWAVILVAAISAIIGDTIGYWIGRRGGRKLLLREGRFSAHRHAAVEKADRYFEKYGLVTVFFARFVPGVRVVGAIAAGTTEMRFRNFAMANALGCFAWATTVASVAYAVGSEGAVVLVIIGFSIAGIGLISAWLNARRHAAAESAVDGELVTDESGVQAADPLVTLGTAVAGRPAPAFDGAVATAPPGGKHPHGAKPAPGKTPTAAMTLAACSNRLP